jgi:hypothetical protein
MAIGETYSNNMIANRSSPVGKRRRSRPQADDGDDVADVTGRRSSTLTICTTGYSATGLRELQSRVRDVLGEHPVVFNATLTIACSVLIVASAGSPKHAAAMRAGVPCVDPSWVTEGLCELAATAAYPVKALRGQVVCASSLSPVSMEFLKTAVEANGGEFTARLDRRCDVLVVPVQGANPASEKVKFAIANSIRISPLDRLYKTLDRSTLAHLPSPATEATTSSAAYAAACENGTVDASVRLTKCVVCLAPSWLATPTVIRKVQALGMRRVPVVTATTTHLVLLGSSYDVVPVDLASSLRIVTVKWLDECYERRMLVPSGAHKATLPFEPIITFSGVPEVTRNHLASAVLGLGGKVQDSFVVGSSTLGLKAIGQHDAACTTHLVVAPAHINTSDKVRLLARRFAAKKREECRVVSPEFIVASAVAGHWVDSAPYRIDISQINITEVEGPNPPPLQVPPTALPNSVANGGSPPMLQGLLAIPESCRSLSGVPASPRRGFADAIARNTAAGETAATRTPPSSVHRPQRGATQASFDVEAFLDRLDDQPPSLRPVGGSDAHMMPSIAIEPLFAPVHRTEFMRAATNASPPQARPSCSDASQVVVYRHEMTQCGIPTSLLTTTLPQNSNGAAAVHTSTVPLMPDSLPQQPSVSAIRPMAMALLAPKRTVIVPNNGGSAPPAAGAAGTGPPQLLEPSVVVPAVAPAVWVPAASDRRIHVTRSAREALGALDVEGAIARLGGTALIETARGATHLITARPNKTEAFLTALAGRLHVLRPEYLKVAIASGLWPDEEPYEWSPEFLDERDRKSDTLRKLVLASRQARQRARRSPLAAWRAVVCGSDAERARSFVSILEVGGALNTAFVLCPSRPTQQTAPTDGAAARPSAASVTSIALPADVNMILLDDSVDVTLTLALISRAWSALGKQGEPRVLKVAYLIHVLCDDGSLTEDSPEVTTTFHPLGLRRK